MSGDDRVPRVDVRSAGDKAAREQARAAYEAATARRKAASAANSARTSPYDLVADSLMNACGDAIFNALNSPDFAYELEKHHGLVIVPALTSEPPVAPWEWAESVLDFLDPDRPADPIERIDDLWAQAWRAGHEAASAASGQAAAPHTPKDPT